MQDRLAGLLGAEYLEESLLLNQTTKMHIDSSGEQKKIIYSFTLELKTILLAAPY
jgi:hypothetical protein